MSELSPLAFKMPAISRALARHDASTAYTLLREELPEGVAGRALLELIRTQPDWPKAHEGPPIELLTTAELGVLRLASEGLTNQEIARRTFRSFETVKSHFKSALAKLDARSRTQAVKIAADRGLLE